MGKTQVRPRTLTVANMKRVGVTWSGNIRNIRFTCDRCGSIWLPNLLPGGRLPRRYWQCPAGCNCPTQTE